MKNKPKIKMKSIFVITRITQNKATQCHAWFENAADAKRFVIKTKGLDEAGYYPFIVIEEVKRGYNGSREVAWYQFSDNEYIQREKPKQFENTVCFGFA